MARGAFTPAIAFDVDAPNGGLRRPTVTLGSAKRPYPGCFPIVAKVSTPGGKPSSHFDPEGTSTIRWRRGEIERIGGGHPLSSTGWRTIFVPLLEARDA